MEEILLRVSEAMINGVPMLVCPISNDQPINAECVEKLGIGKRIDINKLNDESLWDIIDDILRDKNITPRAKETKEKLKNMKGAETAAKKIISFIVGPEQE